jgi:hypothetical protein
MNPKYTYVVLESGKPICVGQSLKYIREYLDNYCGVPTQIGEFIDFEPHNSKYPDDYQGQFIYKEFWSTPDEISEEMIYFKVYEVDVALPTKEQKRNDNIDELLQ